MNDDPTVDTSTPVEITRAVLRRLPWASESGKPSFVAVTGSERTSVIAQLADLHEDHLVDGARELHARAVALLNSDAGLGEADLRYAGRRLAEELGNALLVLELRAERAPRRPWDDSEDVN